MQCSETSQCAAITATDLTQPFIIARNARLFSQLYNSDLEADICKGQWAPALWQPMLRCTLGVQFVFSPATATRTPSATTTHASTTCSATAGTSPVGDRIWNTGQLLRRHKRYAKLVHNDAATRPTGLHHFFDDRGCRTSPVESAAVHRLLAVGHRCLLFLLLGVQADAPLLKHSGKQTTTTTGRGRCQQRAHYTGCRSYWSRATTICFLAP
mmetsp:Transcript_7531/g.13878  ORF Transcript_7531/g.13878 Transcript_7531/m.13878 type:complete len:212 (+) Transcript_7531:135-770(+)